jgi:hypothetical protein
LPIGHFRNPKVSILVSGGDIAGEERPVSEIFPDDRVVKMTRQPPYSILNQM